MSEIKILNLSKARCVRGALFPPFYPTPHPKTRKAVLRLLHLNINYYPTKWQHVGRLMAL